MSEHKEGMPGVVRTSLWGLGLFIGLALIASVFIKVPAPRTVHIDGKSYTVLVADSTMSRYAGLSGKTPSTLHADGMMFLFPSAAPETFTMRGMLFPLDFVWVEGGRVVKIDENIPFPLKGQDPVEVSSNSPIDTVFEFPAGFVGQNHLNIGDIVATQ